MALECLVLTHDAALLAAIKSRFEEFGIQMFVRNDAASAIELSSRHHLDGFVVDCDDISDGKEALKRVVTSPANKRSVLLAITNGGTSLTEAFEMGAQFVMNKPVQDQRLRGFLDVALPRMEREHRRYFRHEVNLPVELHAYEGRTWVANMRNVSEGGFAIRIGEPLPEGVLTVHFELPSIDRAKVRGRAIVVWTSTFITGVRFLYIDPRCRADFQAWLNSLESQLRFRESMGPIRVCNSPGPRDV
jgi:CheY-like chemotaxis protein